jgi:hypothetical protein
MTKKSVLYVLIETTTWYFLIWLIIENEQLAAITTPIVTALAIRYYQTRDRIKNLEERTSRLEPSKGKISDQR